MPFTRPRKLYKRRRTYPKKRTYKRRAYTSARRTKALKKIVEKVISRNVEDKTFQDFTLAYDIVPSNAANFDTQILPVAPDAGYLTITQGTGQGQRIGNRIKIKKLTMTGVMYPTAYNATTNPTPAPVQVKMWLFYDKEEPQSVPTPKANNDFLQLGNASTFFQNSLMDLYAPVNKDRYGVLWTGITKLGYQSYGGTGATGSLPLQGNLSNNDFQLNSNFAIDLTKMVPKYYEFRDASTNPTTRGLFLMCQPVYANGASMAAATIPCKMDIVMSVDFEDA